MTPAHRAIDLETRDRVIDPEIRNPYIEEETIVT